MASLPEMAARALGLRAPGAALLTRPDGVPLAQWSSTRHVADLKHALSCYLTASGHVRDDDQNAPAA